MKPLPVLLLLPLAVSAADPWAVIGRQGLVQFVAVPATLAADRAAYDEQLARLCRPETTCFVNFYAVKPDTVLPLSDDGEKQATATFRRSMKNGAERFQWACRVKPGAEGCF